MKPRTIGYNIMKPVAQKQYSQTALSREDSRTLEGELRLKITDASR